MWVLTFYHFCLGSVCRRKQVSAISEFLCRSLLLLRPLPFSGCLSVSTLLPSSCTMWCQVGTALLRRSRSDHRLLSSVWEQICHYSAARWSDWNHTEHISDVMQLPHPQPQVTPHIKAVQVFKHHHICLNTGIKLGDRVGKGGIGLSPMAKMSWRWKRVGEEKMRW